MWWWSSPSTGLDWTGLYTPWGFQETEAPQFSWRSAQEGGKVVTPSAFTRQEIFLVIIYFKGWVDPKARMIMSMKNWYDANGNRTRDLPACSAVCQPIALLRGSKIIPLLCEVIQTVPRDVRYFIYLSTSTVFCFLWLPYLYHLVALADHKNTFIVFVNNQLDAQFFSCMFISIHYKFRTAICPSSGELIVSIRHLVYGTVCRWPSGMQLWMELFHPNLHIT